MFTFQKLEVYKKASNLNRNIYQLIKSSSFQNYISNQLGRASLSIMLNIAEGSGKFGLKDKRNFYIISRASVFETVSIIEFLYLEKEIKDDDYEKLLESLTEVSKMLYRMIKNLDVRIREPNNP